MSVRYRQTARVIPVSAPGRVLLLCWHDPVHPDAPYWGTIGGGIEPGETAREAAVRELWEETGITVPPQTPQLPDIIAQAASIAAARRTPSAGAGCGARGGSVRDVTDRTLDVQVVTSVTPGVIEILRPAVGSGSSPELSAHTRRVAEAATTVTGHHEGRLVTAVCIDVDGTRGRVTAIGVARGDRGRGWGRSLIAALPALLGIDGLSAETDADAVGFYRAVGFTVTALGEQYPGVERFACRLRW